MGAPALFQFQQGQGSVSADNLNTFEQTCDTAADLRGFVGTQGMQVYMRGFAAPGDGGQGPFYWNIGGVAPDDNGVTTIVPYGSVSGSGVWTRLPDGTAGNAMNFQASLASNQPILTPSSASVIIFGSVIQNPGGMYNPTTGMVTVPVDGLYLFATSCKFNGTCASGSAWDVNFGNIGPTTLSPIQPSIPSATDIITISFSTIATMTAGATTYVGASLGSMTTLTVESGTGFASMFSGVKIG